MPQLVSPAQEGKPAILEQAGLFSEKKADAPNDAPQTKGRLVDILGDSEFTARRRVDLLKSLELPLSEEEKDEIYAFFQATEPPAEMPVESWRWLMDEIFSLLRHDGTDNAKFASGLAGVYRNSSGDPIIRDYAVQHLGHLLSAEGPPELIVSVLRDAASETQNTIAGTALLALNQNFPQDLQTSAQAVQLASDPETHLTSRLTALQVAAAQRNPEALPVALTLAQDSTQPVSLRVSAIAAVAHLGSSQDQATLQNLVLSRNLRIKSASSSALQKLTQERR